MFYNVNMWLNITELVHYFRPTPGGKSIGFVIRIETRGEGGL